MSGASIPDARLVNFGTSLIDHHHRAVVVAIGNVDGDLPGNQIGGFSGVVFAFAVQTDRIFQPHTVVNIKMKNRHWPSSGQSMPSSNVRSADPDSARPWSPARCGSSTP